MLKRRVVVGAAAVAAGVAASLLVTGGRTSALPPVANLWVDTNGGRCARVSSPAAYSDSAACSSLAGAYSAAQAGDTIYVKAGSYGSESIDARSLGTSVVTIAKEPAGDPVTFSSITSHASYVTFDGLDVSPDPGGYNIVCANCSYPNVGDTSHVTIQNFTTPSIGIGSSYVTLRRGTVGPHNACSGGNEDGIVITGVGQLGGPWAPADHVTINDVAIHDISESPRDCGHVDCIQSFSASHLTIKNSRIWNCAEEGYVGYSFNDNDPSQIDNILIENNMLGKIINGYLGLSMGSGAHDCGHTSIIVQNNTFYGGADAEISCGFRPTVVFRNNVVLGGEACFNWGYNEEWQYDYNVFANPGPGCSATPHAKVCTPLFADPSHANGRANVVAGDRCARGAADPRNYPSTDTYGEPRWAPDAGATAVTPQPSETKLLAPRTKTRGCRVLGPLPDRSCSPGAIYTDATRLIICAPDYASRALDLSERTKAAIYAEYGIPRRHYGRPYEIDQIVPLALGGSNDPANLYPQAASNPSPGFREKNSLESRLHDLLCAGKIRLLPTQRAIARDWVSLYEKVYGRKP